MAKQKKKSKDPDVRALCHRGQYDAAEEFLLAALTRDPADTSAKFQYAHLLNETNRFALAEQHIRAALQADSANPEYLAVLGFALHKQGKFEEGRALYQQALDLEPSCPLALRSMGILWLDVGKFKLAAESLSKSAACDAKDAKTYNCLGLSLQAQNRLDEAISAFSSAISLRPSYENAHQNLVSAYERSNRLADARRCLKSAKQACPGSRVFDLAEAVILRREQRFEEAIKLLEGKTEPHGSLTDAKRRHELAVLYDITRQTNRAFAEFQAFNKAATLAYGITTERKAPYLAGILKCHETVSKQWVSRWRPDPDPPPASESPTFLVGFPRSGTTLMQKVLGSHSAIYAADEVQAMFALAARWKAAGGDYPVLLANLAQPGLKQARDFYFQFHKSDPNWRSSPFFVDKNPLMIQHAVALHRLFPEGKFVFTVRHPCDCVLSSYVQMFEPNDAMVWFYDLDDIVTLYATVMNLWERYLSALPLRVHYVRYEDVVEDFRGSMTNLLDFLGLAWEDQLVSFHKSADGSGAVRTASYEQVSKPLYADAAFRWHRYAEHLEPYLDRLAPYAKRFGYSMEVTR